MSHEHIEDLWKQICEIQAAHINILTSALAEIKATDDGESAQPISDIINGCIEEVRELSPITRAADLRNEIYILAVENFLGD